MAMCDDDEWRIALSDSASKQINLELYTFFVSSFSRCLWICAVIVFDDNGRDILNKN